MTYRPDHGGVRPFSPRRPATRLRPLALALAYLGAGSAWAQTQLAPIEVIEAAPLPGFDLPRSQLPANLQVVETPALAPQRSLAQALARALPGVGLNEIQGNPWQADLNYRGFTASPLLGTPQGVSVFLDGVRINEGFGDVVNWDLVPQRALATATVVPGSNPLYGLNTLGGALVLRSKRGDRDPGGEIELSGGDFGRRQLGFEHGGAQAALNWYVAAEGVEENGWRERSPSRLGQLFGRLGWVDGRTDLGLTLLSANTNLTGNGLLPESLRTRREESVFTHPDQTRNRLDVASFSASHGWSDSDQLAASLYLRQLRTRTRNGDANDDYEDDLEDGGDPAPAADNGTRTEQRSWGAGVQWSRQAGAHQYAVGAGWDDARADFRQTSREAEFTASRGIAPEGETEIENQLNGRQRTASVYLTDSVALSPALQLTGSLRYQQTRVITHDELSRSAPNLDGDYTYRKLNPALGATWALHPALTAYAGFTQGSRAPTPIELGCADPANPCTLPNALASDPYLDQVVARTFELGLRGGDARLQWNAALWRTAVRDDILFVGTGQGSSAGYFTNYGRTRREGAELSLQGEASLLQWRVGYAWLRATFQSEACLLAANNSTRGEDARCADDEIRVRPGDFIPGLPQHSLRLGLTWRASERLRLGAELQGWSSQYVRGNENNRHRASEDDGGSGRLPGYALLGVDADYQLAAGWTLFGRVDNVFDQDYASAGALAENPFDADGRFQADPDDWRGEQFVAPGSPRAAWIGMRYRWGGA